MKYTIALAMLVSMGAFAETSAEDAEHMTHDSEVEFVLSAEAVEQMKAQMEADTVAQMEEMLQSHSECAALELEVMQLSADYAAAVNADADYTVLKPIETVLIDTSRLYRENCSEL